MLLQTMQITQGSIFKRTDNLSENISELPKSNQVNARVQLM